MTHTISTNKRIFPENGIDFIEIFILYYSTKKPCLPVGRRLIGDSLLGLKALRKFEWAEGPEFTEGSSTERFALPYPAPGRRRRDACPVVTEFVEVYYLGLEPV